MNSHLNLKIKLIFTLWDFEIEMDIYFKIKLVDK